MVDVSIIVPIYNREQTLPSCLMSISNIKIKRYEVILIDDGSTDNTPLICKEFCKKHPEASYFRKNNSGVSSARNLGIIKSKGEWITFIDSDDTVSPEHLDFLDSYDVTFSDFVILGLSKFITYNREDIKKSSNPAKYYFTEFDNNHTYNFSVWGKFYKRNICNQFSIRFREDISYGEDSIFNYTYLLHSENIIQYLNYKTYNQTDFVILGEGQRLTSKLLSLDEYYNSFVSNYRSNRCLDIRANLYNIRYGVNTLVYAFINYTLINYCRIKHRKLLKHGEHLDFIRNKIKPIFIEILPYKHYIKKNHS